MDSLPGGSGDQTSLPSMDQLNNLWKQINQQQQQPNTGESNTSKPPPLPPRPGQSGSQFNIANNLSGDGFGAYGGGFGSGYGSSMMNPFMGGGYGVGGYGGYGGIPRYGMYGQGTSAGDGSDFVRMAEESSRQAFQSIESIVHAFGSVSMMLESTYFAVHSSFRAVLGVADHLTRMKGTMSQVVANMTIIRTLTIFLRRIAYILGLRDVDPTDESAWREAATQQSMNSPEAIAEALIRPDKKSSWPIMMFFAVVFGTPWLIWKLLVSLSGGSTESGLKWMLREGDHYIAKGLYDFATNNAREIAFTAGQEIIIAPKEKQPSIQGWLLASVDGVKVGLVPLNYVQIVAFNSQASNPSAVISRPSVKVPMEQIQSEPSKSGLAETPKSHPMSSPSASSSSTTTSLSSSSSSSSDEMKKEPLLPQPPSRETASLDQDKEY